MQQNQILKQALTAETNLAKNNKKKKNVEKQQLELRATFNTMTNQRTQQITKRKHSEKQQLELTATFLTQRPTKELGKKQKEKIRKNSNLNYELRYFNTATN